MCAGEQINNMKLFQKVLCLYPFKTQQDGAVPVISSLLMNIDRWKVFPEISTMGFTNVT